MAYSGGLQRATQKRQRVNGLQSAGFSGKWRFIQQSVKKVKSGFDIPERSGYYAPRSNDSSVVQSVERRTVNPYVTGS
ncbi:hypothetical protein, partial [Pantoea sp. BAV 3049]|uniref:hypothetical protein n=1 Tax=Pantoea sp. BAV 3049 TaxID=2654188 RepID=UPI001E40B227